MGKVLGIVYRAISTHLIHKAGFSLKDGTTGAVTLIQRFGWYGTPAALNLNIQFHILFLDGVYVDRDNHPPRFQRVKAPDKGELEELVQRISQRVGCCLERQGLLEQDTESAWLDLDPAEDTDAMPQILGSSISYRISVGPQQGRKAFMIRTIRPLERPDPRRERMAKEARRRTKVVGAFPDGNSALILVAARLRHVSSTTWGTRKYMNMKLLNEMDQEAIYSVA